MEVKNLFDPSVKEEMVARINQLNPSSKQLWGRMNAAQMLAHVQMPMGIAFGTHQPKGNFILNLVGPLFKSKLWDDKPYGKGLPTDPTFIMTGTDKDFEEEKTRLINLVNGFSEERVITERHPIFGKMTKENWSKATWKHLDHHLRQFGV